MHNGYQWHDLHHTITSLIKILQLVQKLLWERMHGDSTSISYPYKVSKLSFLPEEK
jgi:hypothetical protein